MKKLLKQLYYVATFGKLEYIVSRTKQIQFLSNVLV